ncbi:ABC transporter permease [Kroppenstedtia eburnea]|uniref:ABC-2 type transport system permease protein n=1 Tax=Kroppenstedtia eburnea TaxID=714067 RepID=A0A1N7MJH8_9BACL|nr:ABC transporter permease [Kroppenstedtia eburnea]QKI81603.1 ABC transporter permease subunit [Kroppenstedtia eburnea]SIS86089.1 hypothetical protein SAMN05421790_106129 [Kroppenstedtia eburnea]
MNLRLLKAEGAKLGLICFLLPVGSGLLLIAVTVAQWQYHLRWGSGDDYVIFNMMYLFLPLSIFLTGAILTSMVAGTEHESKGWKQLLAFPFPRFQMYLAKFFWVLILMLLKAMVIILITILIWVLFISSPLPLAFLIKQVLFSVLAYTPILIIQLFLAIRLENQAIPIACGVLGAIAGRFLPLFSMEWLYALPWSYSGLVSPFLPDHLFWLQVSLGVSLFLLIITAAWFQRLEWK